MKKNLYFIALFLSSINYILFNTIGLSEMYKYGIRFMVIGLVLLYIILNSNRILFSGKDIILLFLVMTPIFAFSINPNVLNGIFIILHLFASKDIALEEFLKKNAYIALIGALLIVLMLALGFVHNEYYAIDGRLRNTFGFKNVNAFSIFVYSLSMLLFLLINNTKKRYLLMITLFVYVIYSFTDTRSLLYGVIIYLVAIFFLNFVFKIKNINKYNIFIKISTYIIIMIPIILSLMSSIILRSFPYLDVLTSYRISINSNYIESNSVLNFLFGGSLINDIDNGFLVIIFSIGLPFFIFSMYIMMKSISRLIDYKNSKYISFLVSFIYFSAFESLIIRPEMSIAICFWVLIYKVYKAENDTNDLSIKKSLTV